MAGMEEIARQEQRTRYKRQYAHNGVAWELEARNEERALLRMEMGDDIDD